MSPDTSDSETEQETSEMAERQVELAHQRQLAQLQMNCEPTRYEEVDAFTEDAFPSDWTEADLDFLAKFLRDYFDAHLVQTLGEEDWDYTLFVPERDA